MTRRSLLCTLAFLLSLTCFRAVQAQDDIDRLHAAAQEAYLTGNFDLCIENYQTLVSAGIRDPDIYFNLGVAHMAADEPGLAILQLERALSLRSGDAQAREALRSFRQEVTRREADARGEATLASDSSVLEAFFRPIPTEVLEPAALALWTLLFMSLIALLRMRTESSRIRLGLATVALALLATVSIAGLSVRQSWFAAGEAAIYTGETGPVRQGPDQRTDILGHIVTGAPCRLIQTDTDFAEVQTPSGAAGWVPLANVQAIHR